MTDEFSRKGKIVEPNKNIANSYNSKSRSTLSAAKMLLENKFFEESISMAYYSMYNKTTSLFSIVGIKSENHSLTIILLKEVFNLDNDKLRIAKKERIEKQYYTNSDINKEDAVKIISLAEQFIDEIDEFIDKITLEDISIYRIKFKQFLSNYS